MSWIINQHVKNFVIVVNIHKTIFYDRYDKIFKIRNCRWWAICANKLNNLDKGPKSVEEKYFLNNRGLFFPTRERVLHNFKSRAFPMINQDKTPEPATEAAVELASKPAPNSKVSDTHKSKKNITIKYLKNILLVTLHHFNKRFIWKKSNQ